jgi:hypothetical protein
MKGTNSLTLCKEGVLVYHLTLKVYGLTQFFDSKKNVLKICISDDIIIECLPEDLEVISWNKS